MNQNPVWRPRVLIVDDVPANIEVLRAALTDTDYQIVVALDGETALKLAAKNTPDLVLLDVFMPAPDGYEVCRRLKADPATADIPVIFLTANDQQEGVVAGFDAGGVDYLTKPFESRELLARVRTHLEIGRLNRELAASNRELTAANDELRHEIARRTAAETAREKADARLDLLSGAESRHWDIDGIVGQSASLQHMLSAIEPLRAVDATGVLIRGESGTGKELVARAIHRGSRRADRPFVALNCSAIPSELAESTFFGHVKGAFTGATADKAGYFELADGGTLFLDEMGDMPLELQAKLLRVLEDGHLLPVGGTEEKQVDVRVLAATHVDLPRRVAERAFRQDLFYRLTGYVVDVPPLRQRREDVPLLIEHFRQLFAREMGIAPPPFSAAALARLQDYDYPGNIRELKNLVEFALIQCGGAMVQPEHVHFLEIPRVQPAADPASQEEQILAFARQRGSISNAECRDLLQIERRRAAYLLEKMNEAGQLILEGKNRGARYVIATD